MDVLPWICQTQGKWPCRQTGRQSIHHKWLVALKIWTTEQFETLRVGTKPRASHHWLPGGQRCREEVLDKKRTRKGHRHPDKHWNCLKVKVGETSDIEQNTYRLFRMRRYHLKLNWTKLRNNLETLKNYALNSCNRNEGQIWPYKHVHVYCSFLPSSVLYF